MSTSLSIFLFAGVLLRCVMFSNTIANTIEQQKFNEYLLSLAAKCGMPYLRDINVAFPPCTVKCCLRKLNILDAGNIYHPEECVKFMKTFLQNPADEARIEKAVSNCPKGCLKAKAVADCLMTHRILLGL
ncbi:uncharacterized protein isoform X2 [Choristoneura fumiferana]|uniref:uncharacterized protein isoform X2 n=1 Tax=Choristoneura fumiferana TaxID=7141 RepID=UPI003D15D2B3